MTDDPKWLAWRKAGVTATDVADAAAGTYGGMYGVVARKTGRVTVEKTSQMQRGLDWEHPIADAVHILTGYYIVGEQGLWENPEDPRMRATLDGCLALTPEADIDALVAVYECKTVEVNVKPNRDRWYSQMQWQMLVTGLKKALLAEARIDDSDNTLANLRLEWVDADDLVQEDLLDLAQEIFNHVNNGTMPEPGVGSLAVVKEVHATADPDLNAVSLDALGYDLAKWEQMKEQKAEAEDLLEVIEARIREAMGEATKGATATGWKVALSLPARKLTAEREAELLETHPEYGIVTLDRTRVKAEAKELYESFQTRAGARRLTVTPPKEF